MVDSTSLMPTSTHGTSLAGAPRLHFIDPHNFMSFGMFESSTFGIDCDLVKLAISLSMDAFHLDQVLHSEKKGVPILEDKNWPNT